MGAWFKLGLQRQWYGRGRWCAVLLPVSALFWLLTSVRRLAYARGWLASYRLPVAVIVIGNISVGGTGKTPLAIWLLHALKRRGFRPGVVSRGYGGSVRSTLAVQADSDARQVGDEPVLIARRVDCPVWIGADRVAAAQALLQAHPQCDVIVTDDGLQHYRLQRDVEIVVIDSHRGLGNGWLLPAGPLREAASRLNTVDAVVYNGDSTAEGAYGMQLSGAMFYNLRYPERHAVAADFAGKHILAMAGIGNPQRFFVQLEKLGLIFERKALPDHHLFQPVDLQAAEAEVILMTEKDAVKCTAFASDSCWYLQVSASVDEALADRIVNQLRKRNGYKAS